MVKSGTLIILVCIYVYGHRENSAKALLSDQKCWLIWLLTSLLFVSWLHAPESHSQLTASLLQTNCFSAPDWPLRGLTPNWLTLFIFLFRSHRFSWAQLFVRSSRQDKERSSGHFGATLKMPEISSSAWPPIHEHTERPTHTHSYIFIYIYIHTWMLIIVPHEQLNPPEDLFFSSRFRHLARTSDDFVVLMFSERFWLVHATIVIICLNFWDKDWCAIFCERLFGLLSASLLLLVVSTTFRQLYPLAFLRFPLLIRDTWRRPEDTAADTFCYYKIP